MPETIMQLIGPFETYHVVVEGRVIPRLTGRKVSEYQTALTVDGRFSATFTDDAAGQAAWLIAQALAIGEGFSHLGAEAKSYPFAPRSMGIEPASLDGEA